MWSQGDDKRTAHSVHRQCYVFDTKNVILDHKDSTDWKYLKYKCNIEKDVMYSDYWTEYSCI